MPSLKGLISILTSKAYRIERNKNLFQTREMKRLLSLDDRENGETDFLGPCLRFVNGKSFISLKREMFDREIYRFECKKDSPLIIDGGANIGLSVLYFKKLFPNSRIIAFEPDPKIFEILRYNVSSAGLTDVTIYNEALWNENSNISFFQEGKESGRVVKDQHNTILVKCRRLGEFLNQSIDFLKLDIEGAELRVMSDIKEQLSVVERIFVEYHSYVDKIQDLDVILKILKDAGFRIHLENSGPSSPSPFVNINNYQNMDLLVNIFAYR